VCRCPFDPFIYHGRSVNARLTLIGRARRSIGRIRRAGGPPHRQPWWGGGRARLRGTACTPSRWGVRMSAGDTHPCGEGTHPCGRRARLRGGGRARLRGVRTHVGRARTSVWGRARLFGGTHVCGVGAHVCGVGAHFCGVGAHGLFFLLGLLQLTSKSS
jgi:hypothetical protein